MTQKSNKTLTFAPSATSTTNGTTGTEFKTKLSDKEKKKMQDLIRNAKSLAEISKLEKDLAEGRIPAGVLGGKDMDTS